RQDTQVTEQSKLTPGNPFKQMTPMWYPPGIVVVAGDWHEQAPPPTRKGCPKSSVPHPQESVAVRPHCPRDTERRHAHTRNPVKTTRNPTENGTKTYREQG